MQRLKNIILQGYCSDSIDYSRVSPYKVGLCVRVLGLLESKCRITTGTWNRKEKKLFWIKNKGFHERKGECPSKQEDRTNTMTLTCTKSWATLGRTHPIYRKSVHPVNLSNWVMTPSTRNLGVPVLPSDNGGRIGFCAADQLDKIRHKLGWLKHCN